MAGAPERVALEAPPVDEPVELLGAELEDKSAKKEEEDEFDLDYINADLK